MIKYLFALTFLLASACAPLGTSEAIEVDGIYFAVAGDYPDSPSNGFVRHHIYIDIENKSGKALCLCHLLTPIIKGKTASQSYEYQGEQLILSYYKVGEAWIPENSVILLPGVKITISTDIAVAATVQQEEFGFQIAGEGYSTFVKLPVNTSYALGLSNHLEISNEYITPIGSTLPWVEGSQLKIDSVSLENSIPTIELTLTNLSGEIQNGIASKQYHDFYFYVYQRNSTIIRYLDLQVENFDNWFVNPGETRSNTISLNGPLLGFDETYEWYLVIAGVTTNYGQITNASPEYILIKIPN